MKKTLIAVVSTVLICCCVFGGTLAWLMDSTQTITNTFTIGKVDIELAETATEFKLVPGNTIAKDPKVTVKANSEDCYVFVKVTPSENLSNFVTYAKAEGWNELETGVWYREVATSNSDATFSVLAGDSVTVIEGVTQAQLNEVATTNQPTLAFTAYAVQQDNIDDVATAWTQAQTAVANP